MHLGMWIWKGREEEIEKRDVNDLHGIAIIIRGRIICYAAGVASRITDIVKVAVTIRAQCSSTVDRSTRLRNVLRALPC